MYVEGAVQLPDIRQSWEQVANERLAAAGLDVRINHRSHQEGDWRSNRPRIWARLPRRCSGGNGRVPRAARRRGGERVMVTASLAVFCAGHAG